MITALIKGKIPPNTKCPYHERCAMVNDKKCKHLGINHLTEYSCELARFAELMDSVEDEKRAKYPKIKA